MHARRKKRVITPCATAAKKIWVSCNFEGLRVFLSQLKGWGMGQGKGKGCGERNFMEKTQTQEEKSKSRPAQKLEKRFVWQSVVSTTEYYMTSHKNNPLLSQQFGSFEQEPWQRHRASETWPVHQQRTISWTSSVWARRMVPSSQLTLATKFHTLMILSRYVFNLLYSLLSLVSSLPASHLQKLM